MSARRVGPVGAGFLYLAGFLLLALIGAYAAAVVGAWFHPLSALGGT